MLPDEYNSSTRRTTTAPLGLPAPTWASLLLPPSLPIHFGHTQRASHLSMEFRPTVRVIMRQVSYHSPVPFFGCHHHGGPPPPPPPPPPGPPGPPRPSFAATSPTSASAKPTGIIRPMVRLPRKYRIVDPASRERVFRRWRARPRSRSRSRLPRAPLFDPRRGAHHHEGGSDGEGPGHRGPGGSWGPRRGGRGPHRGRGGRCGHRGHPHNGFIHPEMDIVASDDAYTVTIELPCLRKDVEISVDGCVLTISGEFKPDTGAPTPPTPSPIQRDTRLSIPRTRRTRSSTSMTTSRRRRGKSRPF